MKQKCKWPILIVIALAIAAVSAQAGSLAIDHTPIECIVHDTFAVLDAGFAPLAEADSGRVYFRAKDTKDWYYVRFDGATTPWTAVLPKPLPGLEGIDYYLRGTDLTGADSDTDEYHPIVSTRTYCENESVTVAQSADSDNIALVIGILDPDQDALPPGFSAEGIAGTIMPNGQVQPFPAPASADSTATAGDGGLGPMGLTGIVVGGVAVVGGAYYALDDGNPIDDGGGSEPFSEETLIGNWRVIEQSGTVEGWYAEVLLRADYTVSLRGYFNAQPLGENRGTWVFTPSTWHFDMVNFAEGGSVEGTISESENGFLLVGNWDDGTWVDGNRGVFHWVRQ